MIAGDLVVYPIPYIYDGYPSEWIQTMQNLGQLDADTIVPGHGPMMHDKAYIFLIRDLLKSAVDQMNAELKQTGPAMFQHPRRSERRSGLDSVPATLCRQLTRIWPPPSMTWQLIS